MGCQGDKKRNTLTRIPNLELQFTQISQMTEAENFGR
jgi:hypothetical protein